MLNTDQTYMYAYGKGSKNACVQERVRQRERDRRQKVKSKKLREGEIGYISLEVPTESVQVNTEHFALYYVRREILNT